MLPYALKMVRTANEKFWVDRFNYFSVRFRSIASNKKNKSERLFNQSGQHTERRAMWKALAMAYQVIIICHAFFFRIFSSSFYFLFIPSSFLFIHLLQLLLNLSFLLVFSSRWYFFRRWSDPFCRRQMFAPKHKLFHRNENCTSYTNKC